MVLVLGPSTRTIVDVEFEVEAMMSLLSSTCDGERKREFARSCGPKELRPLLSMLWSIAAAAAGVPAAISSASAGSATVRCGSGVEGGSKREPGDRRGGVQAMEADALWLSSSRHSVAERLEPEPHLV
jgi:hypothetical protein